MAALNSRNSISQDTEFNDYLQIKKRKRNVTWNMRRLSWWSILVSNCSVLYCCHCCIFPWNWYHQGTFNSQGWSWSTIKILMWWQTLCSPLGFLFFRVFHWLCRRSFCCFGQYPVITNSSTEKRNVPTFHSKCPRSDADMMSWCCFFWSGIYIGVGYQF